MEFRRVLFRSQWDVASLRDLLEHVVPDSEAIRGFEVEDEFPGLGRRIFKLDAREISATGNQAGRLLVAFEDVTESRLLERHKDILAAELSHRIKNSLQIIASFVHFELRDAPEIGRAHVCTPVTNAHLVCRFLPETKTTIFTNQNTYT